MQTPRRSGWPIRSSSGTRTTVGATMPFAGTATSIPSPGNSHARQVSSRNCFSAGPSHISACSRTPSRNTLPLQSAFLPKRSKDRASAYSGGDSSLTFRPGEMVQIRQRTRPRRSDVLGCSVHRDRLGRFRAAKRAVADGTALDSMIRLEYEWCLAESGAEARRTPSHRLSNKQGCLLAGRRNFYHVLVRSSFSRAGLLISLLLEDDGSSVRPRMDERGSSD